MRSVRSAGLYALGATSVGYLVGARGAGTIRSHCRRCAHVARRRSSHLAPPVHWLPAPSHTAARGSQPMVGCCGLVERTLALQVVEARLCARRGLCTAWRQVSGRRALRWRRCRCWRRAMSMRGRPAAPTSCERANYPVCVCLRVVKIAPHLGSAPQNVCAFDIFSILTLTLRARHRPTD